MPDNVAEMLDEERELAIRWYGATHSEFYDATIQKESNDILDRFIEAQQKPDLLKTLVPGMDSDYDRINFARGVVWVVSQVLGWKSRAEMAQEEIRQAGENVPEAEDVGSKLSEQWYSR